MKYSHCITAEDLSAHPEVFVAGAEAGQHVMLAANDMAVLGIKTHTITEDDLANNEGMDGATVGDVIPVEEAEAVATLVKEAEASAALTPSDEEVTAGEVQA